jgi:hypothetical protein
VSLRQDDAGVVATIKSLDSGTSQVVHANYLIAADGTHSHIRRELKAADLGDAAGRRLCRVYRTCSLRSRTGSPWPDPNGCHAAEAAARRSDTQSTWGSTICISDVHRYHKPAPTPPASISSRRLIGTMGSCPYRISKRFQESLAAVTLRAGLPPYGERSAPYSLPQSGDGFRIECKGCRKPFVSRGLRCCSPECERSYREQLDIKSTMAEVGMEPMREKRKCEECGGDIPLWRKGKAVRSDSRFCSSRCQAKAKRKLHRMRRQKPA